jgi:ATP/ADP translocase
MPVVLNRILRQRLNLSQGEGRLVALMGALLATILFAYTIAKVLRDGLFLGTKTPASG